MMRITTFGVAMSLAVMLIAISVVTGFRHQIANKVTGFAAHVQIVNYDSNLSYETRPIKRNQSFLGELAEIPEIRHIQTFATKPGLAKTDVATSGLILKGIGSDFDWSFFTNNLSEGNSWTPSDTLRSNNILISLYTARQLALQPGDSLSVWFMQNPPRARKFVVAGIYETGLEEFDKFFALIDIAHIQRLNQWPSDYISGFEIFFHDFRQVERFYPKVYDTVGTNYSDTDATLQVISVTDRYAQIFDWLRIIDTNVWIILTLMVLVAGFNMISGLLIMILERTRTIGILKSLGASNPFIRNIFLMQSFSVILKGLFWGNLIGLGLLFIQYSTGILTLDQSQYFLAEVPVEFNVVHILLLNGGTLLAVWSMLLLPSMIIAHISPDKSIRFQ